MDETFDKAKRVYRANGYLFEKDFPGEYLLMVNETTGERVRLYYNGKILEGYITVSEAITTMFEPMMRG
jgi:hypothetical protein